MKICIFGAGGVGGYFGGRLAEAGEDVHFVARGAHAEAMRKHGLTVSSVGGDVKLDSVNVIQSPRSAGPFDIVLVGVKAWQVIEAAESIKGSVADYGVVIPLLNGVEASEQLVSVLGPDNVVEGLCGIVAYIEQPGHINHVGLDPFIQLGERDGSSSARLAEVVSLFNRAKGITASLPEDMRVALWRKFLFIVAMSGVGAVTRAPIGVSRSIPATRKLLIGCVTEAATVGRALGVPLPDDIVDGVMKVVDGAPAEATASMQRDIASGKPSELATQNAAVVRLGTEVNIDTPINEFISAALTPLERRARGDVSF